MSYGSGHTGGRTQMGTKVLLNVYDLSPANEYLYCVGLGLHHSGVEILGSEYSFAGGSGIFESTPKEAPGALFRETLDLGTFHGGSADIRRIVSDLREDFDPNSYNLIRKNCNHFANSFVWALLGRCIPPHINRFAELGACCSCLLPRQMLEDAPVGPDGSRGGGSDRGFQVYGGGGRSGSGSGAGSQDANSFSGAGFTLGGSGRTTARNRVSTHHSSAGTDDLTDRREKARQAAMARLQTQNQNAGDS